VELFPSAAATASGGGGSASRRSAPAPVMAMARGAEEGADVAAAKRLGLPLVMAADDLDVRLGHPSFGLHSRTGKV